MSRIHRIEAFQILDSRGNPTIACQVHVTDGTEGWAYVPSGASRGSLEALELRDNLPAYRGLSVHKALHNIHHIIQPEIAGMDVSEQKKIDDVLCALGGEQKKNLGGNATLAVSLACCRAAAASLRIPLFEYMNRFFPHTRPALPIPIFNIVNGGAHGAGNLDIQEFWIVPGKVDSLPEQIRSGVEIYHILKGILRESGLFCGLGDEGGFLLPMTRSEEVFPLIQQACASAGYDFSSEKILLGLDVAASHLISHQGYRLDGTYYTSEELLSLYRRWAEKFPLRLLEDPVAEKDIEGWKRLTQALSNGIMVIGDDVFATQANRLIWAKQEGIANAILIKPNQAGTLTETVECILQAQKAGYTYIISHRSGETEDTFIVDLAVASGAKLLKTGAPARGERTCKYNRLLLLASQFPHIPSQCLK
ncbi:MAG: phosphopyruvate hydratase [bacterium JZ-2024 1]